MAPAASANPLARIVAKNHAARCQCRQRVWPQQGLYGWNLDRVCGVHRASTANRAADFCAIERFVDDLADRARATAALGAAAKAAIDMACGSTRRGVCRGSDLVVAQHVTRTDNHRTPLLGIR